MKRPRILVVGSINMDLFVEGANAIPGYGESIRCRHYGYASGGKGSNQAFAVAKQGADVVFVGCIGDDENGKKVKASLDKAGVNTDYLVIDPDTQTGLDVYKRQSLWTVISGFRMWMVFISTIIRVYMKQQQH